MPRDIPVSNGNILVNFDLDYRIRDIYFPWIGQENHTRGHEFRFGIWVDGCFAWMGPEWEKDLRYRDDSLVTETFLKHERLGLALRCQDAVDFQLNVYVKHIQVIDLAERARDVRLFLAMTFTCMVTRSVIQRILIRGPSPLSTTSSTAISSPIVVQR